MPDVPCTVVTTNCDDVAAMASKLPADVTDTGPLAEEMDRLDVAASVAVLPVSVSGPDASTEMALPVKPATSEMSLELNVASV